MTTLDQTTPNDMRAVLAEATYSLEHLRYNQRQLDADGIEVGVSRQALDEVLSAFDAALSQPDNGWKTMDSAPKDGTTLLLYSPDAIEPQVMLGLWAEWEMEDDPDAWTDAWSMELIDAWPTHWQPLPSPPTTVPSKG